MTDSGPSFPPPEPLPTAAPPAQLPPPQLGTMLAPATFTPAPPRKSLPPVAIVAIVLGGVAGLTGIAVGAVLFSSFVTGIFSTPAASGPVAIPQSAPLEGEPGSPTAVAPDICPETCFSSLDLESTIAPAADLATIGLTVTVDYWTDYPPINIVDQYQTDFDNWRTEGGTPENCFALYSPAPLAFALDLPPDHSQGLITYLGSTTNAAGDSQLSQHLRDFRTSDEAAAHMQMVASAIANCSSYRLDNSGWYPMVTAAPALDVPDNVAALGWVESSGGYRFYVIDLQRGDYVIRSTLYSNGEVSEQQFRDFMTLQAEHLSAIDLG